MKTGLAIAFVLFLSGAAHAQQDKEEKEAAEVFYLFPEFEPAEVLFKSGYRKNTLFNYHLVAEEMIYEEKGRYRALDMPGIDTIYLAGKKFIPFDKMFLEVVSTPPGMLFIRHKRKIISKGKPVGYGGYSQSSATNSISHLTENVNVYKLEVPSEFYLNDKSSFMIRKDKQFYEVNSTRQVLKVFPEKKAAIKKFVKEHNTDFTQPEQVIELLLSLR